MTSVEAALTARFTVAFATELEAVAAGVVAGLAAVAVCLRVAPVAPCFCSSRPPPRITLRISSTIQDGSAPWSCCGAAALAVRDSVS